MTPKQARLLREVVRRQRHRLSTYVPGATALASHQCKAPRVLVTGPSRSGKTYSTGADIGWSVTATHPYRPNVTGEKMFLFCLSRVQANMVWRPLLLGRESRPGVLCEDGMIPPWEIAHVRRGPRSKARPQVNWDNNNGVYTPKQIIMRNGNELSFWWHGDPNQWKRFQGVDFLRGWIDECGDHTDNLMQEIDSRFMDCITRYGIEACYAIWSATDTTANEEYALWWDRAADENDLDYQMFRLKPGENPGISDEARARTASIMLNREDAEVRVWGTRTRGDDHRIFTCFDKSRHIRKDYYKPTSRDNLILAYDPGLKDDTGILFCLMGPKNAQQMNIVHFFTGKGLRVEDEADYIKGWLRGMRIRYITYDKNSCLRREKGSGTSLLRQLKACLDEPDLWWDGEMHFKPPKGQIPAGVKRCFSYLDPPPEVSAEPLVLIDPPDETNGLAKFARELQHYRLRASAMRKELSAASIHPKDNEGPDLLRYLCMCGPHWQDLGENKRQPLSVTETLMVEQEKRILTPSEANYQMQLDRSREMWNRRKGRRRQGLAQY